VEAVEAVHAGEDITVVTPTVSGKTLCYALPVLQAIAEDPESRALFLFPTKALSQDQVAEFSELSRAAGMSIAAATYDGDTPAPIRSAVRKAGQVVVTNPDMLNSGILPHHTKWFQLFEQLRVIVIDELHTYRGVYGSHVANVIRRLLRLCAHYGSPPVIVCCSATIANPSTGIGIQANATNQTALYGVSVTSRSPVPRSSAVGAKPGAGFPWTQY
jgi:DEAD/DEAH box helicase domain-containing protein